ncbi:MAG: HEAT repeat domain-containing protein [Candidatus Latescibacteria bacterium]|nr:HEAT repeat domain-containing protein [Candidatus Latescibacterota bacterium]
MNNLKNSLYNLTIIFMAVISFVITAPGTVYSADSYTQEDAKALKSTDPDAVADVLYKLQDIREASGKEGLKPAVADLITATKRELTLPEDERWNLIDLVKILSMTGDERAKPMLLNIMSVMWGGGNPFVAQGFLAIGKSTVKDVADSLKSASPDTRGRAALTLHKMAQFDESGEFFTREDREKVKKLLVENLDDDDVNVRIYTVLSMQSFGDESVIPILENIEKTDAHKDSGGTYEVRIGATETLKHLRGN